MKEEKMNRIKYVSFILLQSVAYGFGNPLTKVAYESITPFWLLTFRFSMALFIFLIFFWKRIVSQLRTVKFSQYLPASLCMAYVLQNSALAHLSSGTVSMIQCTQPILTAVCAFILLGETLSLGGILGATIIIGSILVLNVMEENKKMDDAINVT